MSFKRLLFYVCLIPIGLILISMVIFWMQVRPVKITGNETPDTYKLKYEEVTLTSYDKTKLSAWYIPAVKETDKAILLLHGYPMDKSDLLGTASLYQANFNVLLLDQRYFGKSEGKYCTFGKKESEDAKIAITFLESKGNKNIGIFGYSIGGATAFLTAEKDSRVKAIATYAPYADLKLLTYEQYGKIPFVGKPFTLLMTLWAKILFGNLPSPKSAAERIKIPVLLIQNPKDEVISFEHGKIFKNALNNNYSAQTYFPEHGGTHNEPPLDFEIKTNYFFKNSL